MNKASSQIPLSIIIVNYNGQKFLKNCLDSILKSTYKSYQIIIFDNASTDNSLSSIESFPNLTIIRSRKNVGFAKANNLASQKATGRYLFFLNNDTKIQPNTLANIVHNIQQDNQPTVYGCKIYDYHNKIHFHSGISLDPFGFPINNKNYNIFYAEGSALIIKKSLFNKIGQFDPLYFMFHEDIDLCWRARLFAANIKIIDNAIINHYAGGSAGGKLSAKNKYTSTVFRRYYSERNNIITLIKNYSLPTLILILPLYLLINLFEFIFLIITFQPKIIFYYLKAYLFIITNFKYILNSRRFVQKNRKVNDLEIMKYMHLGINKLNALQKTGIPHFT